MHAPLPAAPRRPQRLLLAGAGGPALEAYAARVAEALDLPLVTHADLTTAADAERLAAFDGWVLVTTPPDAPAPAVLARAELAVHATLEQTGTLRGLVRRTVRRLRADDSGQEPAWFTALDEPLVADDEPPAPRPAPLRLDGPEPAEAWLAGLAEA